MNSGLSPALAALGKIKEEFEAFGALRSVQYGCSWADCIVLAATAALKRLGVNTRPFCGGRTDAGGSLAPLPLSLWWLKPSLTSLLPHPTLPRVGLRSQ